MQYSFSFCFLSLQEIIPALLSSLFLHNVDKTDLFLATFLNYNVHFYKVIHIVVSLALDIKKSTGNCPVQLAIGGLDGAGGLDGLVSRGPYQPQPISDSGIL